MSAGTTDILLQPEIYEAVIAELKTVRLYIELARAKSEALDNIYSLFKQNIRSRNAKPYKALSMWYCFYYIHTKTFIILPAFNFKSFPNAKMINFSIEMTKKNELY